MLPTGELSRIGPGNSDRAFSLPSPFTRDLRPVNFISTHDATRASGSALNILVNTPSH